MRSVYYLNSHINLNTLDPVQWRTRLYSLVQYGSPTQLKATHYAVELLGPLESVHSQCNNPHCMAIVSTYHWQTTDQKVFSNKSNNCYNTTFSFN